MQPIVMNPENNVQNVVGQSDLRNVIRVTLTQLTNQLLDISGPYSRNAFIMKDIMKLTEGMNVNTIGRSTKNTIFTRDGRTTLKHIGYNSPLQRYIKDDVIDFMGERIDANCKDGTTTSMLFTAAFLLYLMREPASFTFTSTTDIEAAYTRVAGIVLEELEADRVTVADLIEYVQTNFSDIQPKFGIIEARKLIAYMQAYTSSSGNASIAEAVADVIARTPENQHGENITWQFPLVETETTGVEAKQSDFQFRTQAMILTHRMCNHRRNTVYLAESADLLITRSPISNGTTVGIAIDNYLKNRDVEKQKGTDIVLMIPHATKHDFHVIEAWNLLAEERGFRLMILAYNRPNGYNTAGDFVHYIDGISYKADARLLDEFSLALTQDGAYITAEDYVLHGVKVFADTQDVQLDNLIDWSRISEEEAAALKEQNRHPGEVHPELYPHYTDGKQFMLEELEKLYGKIDEANEPVITDIKRTLVMMSQVRHWYVYITGKKHDQEMYQLIVEDAAGAANVAVSKGVFFNGPIRLFNAVRRTVKRLVQERNSENHAPETAIALAMMAAAKDMTYAMFGHFSKRIQNDLDGIVGALPTKFDYLNAYSSINLVESFDVQAFSCIMGGNCRDIQAIPKFDVDALPEPLLKAFITASSFKLQPKSPVIIPPCQVGNLFNVMFDRLREASLRLVFTDNLIAPGTIWTKGKQEGINE